MRIGTTLSAFGAVFFMLFFTACQQDYNIKPRLYFDAEVVNVNPSNPDAKTIILSKFNTANLNSIKILGIKVGEQTLNAYELKPSGENTLELSLTAQSSTTGQDVSISAESADRLPNTIVVKY